MVIQRAHIYDSNLDFEDNKIKGPFGDYANIKKPHKNTGKPKYNFFGVPVHSPFGIAAGPLPTPSHIKAALHKGYDIVTLKSVRTDSFPLHPFPHVHAVDLDGDVDPTSDEPLVVRDHHQPTAVANSFGIPSVTPAEWQPSMRESFAMLGNGQALLAAFQGTAHGKGREDFVQDHVKGVTLIRDAGAEVVEINLSCPNEGADVLACFDTDITERIVKAVRKAHPDLKLMIKLAYFEDKKQLKELIKRVGDKLDGISAINTIPMNVVHKDGSHAFPGRPKAGISGAPIKWAGLDMTRHLKKLRDDLGYNYKIVSMGGVLSATDFHEYVQAGADTVMSVTGAMWNPNLAQEVKASLS